MTVKCCVYLALTVLLAPRPSLEASLDGEARVNASPGASNTAAPSDAAAAAAGKPPRGSDLEEALEKLAGGKIGGGGGGSGVVPQSAARRAAAAYTWSDNLSPAAEHDEEKAAAAADDLDAAELGYDVALLAELGRLAAPDGSPGGVDAELDELDDDAQLLDELERIEAVLDRARDSQPAAAMAAAGSADEAVEEEEEGRERAAVYNSARSGEAYYDSSSLPAEVADQAGGRTGAREEQLDSLLELLAAAASEAEASESTPEPARNLGLGARGRYDERRMFTNSGGRGKKEEPATFASGNAFLKEPRPVAADVDEGFGDLRDAALRRLTHASRQLAAKYVAERLKARRLLAILEAIAPLPAQSRRWQSPPIRQRAYQ